MSNVFTIKAYENEVIIFAMGKTHFSYSFIHTKHSVFHNIPRRIAYERFRPCCKLVKIWDPKLTWPFLQINV